VSSLRQHIVTTLLTTGPIATRSPLPVTIN
jgi:hypothetical protein